MDEKTFSQDFKRHGEHLNKKIRDYLHDETSTGLLIIKTHLIAENYLNQILVLKNSVKATKIDNLTFHDKNEKAFDLNTPIEAMAHAYLTRLNKIRNRVGHDLEYVVAEADIDSLGYIQGQEYIFNKYQIEDSLALLKNVLIHITVILSFVVYKVIKDLKSKETKVDS